MPVLPVTRQVKKKMTGKSEKNARQNDRLKNRLSDRSPKMAACVLKPQGIIFLQNSSYFCKNFKLILAKMEDQNFARTSPLSTRKFGLFIKVK